MKIVLLDNTIKKIRMSLEAEFSPKPLPERSINANSGIIESESNLDSEGKAKKLVELKNRATTVALKILRTYPDDAEEAVSSAYLKAWKALPNFKHESTLETWFSRIVTNEALDILRKHEGRHELSTQVEYEGNNNLSHEIADHRDDPLEILLKQEKKEVVMGLLDRLDPIYRDPIKLNVMDGIPDREVARILGISLPAFKSRRFRGFDKMAKRAKDDSSLKKYFSDKIDTEQ